MEEPMKVDVKESGIVPEKKTITDATLPKGVRSEEKSDATTAPESEKFLKSRIKGKGPMEESEKVDCSFIKTPYIDLEESSAGEGFLPAENKTPTHMGKFGAKLSKIFRKVMGKDATLSKAFKKKKNATLSKSDPTIASIKTKFPKKKDSLAGNPEDELAIMQSKIEHYLDYPAMGKRGTKAPGYVEKDDQEIQQSENDELEIQQWEKKLLKDPIYVTRDKQESTDKLLYFLEEKLRKSLGRLVNLKEIKNPFVFSYAAIFWQKVVADKRDIRNEELWRWRDILASLSEAVDGGYNLHRQFSEFIKFTFASGGISTFLERQSILESGLVEMRLNNLSEDKTLVSTQRIEPPNLLGAPSISELPLYLVPLLAYCALFPKGHRIVKEKLINLWMAEGFLLSFNVGNVFIRRIRWKNQECLGTIGNGYFNELLTRGVFHKCREIGGRVYDCEIHPLAHDKACQIAATEVMIIDNNVHRDKLSMGMNEASYISLNLDGLQKDDIEHVMTQSDCMRTCLFFGNRDAQSPINLRATTINTNNLRVLDLYGTHVDGLSLLPSRSLRYLGLPGNHNISYVGSFDALQTLAVDGFSRVEYNYRQTFIINWYLTTAQKTLIVDRQLQILELSQCKELNFITFDNWDIKRLRIYDCPKLESLLSRIEETFTHLEELIIDYCINLQLTHHKGITSANLKCLRYLELIGLPRLVNLPAGFRSARALENFMIADCPCLESTTMVLQYLSSLNKLCIYNCPKLLALRECAPKLNTLDIRRCPALIESCSTNKGEDWKFISQIPNIILDGVCSMSQDSNFSEDNGVEFDSESVSYFSLKAHTESTIKRGISELYSKLEEMKLQCLIFPDYCEFERNTLIQLWIAADLFTSSEEEIGLGCFSILLSEGYILFSSVDILTGKSMYRVDVEKIKSQFSGMLEDKARRYAMLFDCTTEDDLSSAWHVSIVSNGINGTTFQLLETVTGLKTLKFVFDDYGCSLKQVPYSLFTALPFLQILDLSKSHITELPSSIGDVRCLRYLDLSFTQIEKLPESIDCLTNLQTLKLKGCKQLYTLPKGLKELVSLVHLEFDEHSRLTCMPKGIGALTQLRTLSAFIVGDTGKDCGINELQSLQNLRGSLSISGLEKVSEVSYQELISHSSITRLQLQWSDFTSNGENVADKIFNYGLIPPATIKELQILSFPGSDLSWLLEYYNLTFIERITLLKCENLDIKGWLGSLPSLEYLSITQMKQVKQIDKGFRGYRNVPFPKLEELVIDGMSSLESWTGVESIDFPVLKKFTVMNCPKLSSLPFLPSIPSLQYMEISSCKMLEPFTGTLPVTLETLIINDCPKLKSRCSKEGEDWNKIKHVPQIWIDQRNIRSPLDDTDDDEDESSIADSELDDEELDRFKDLDSLLKHFETRAAATIEEQDNGAHSTAEEC